MLNFRSGQVGPVVGAFLVLALISSAGCVGISSSTVDLSAQVTMRVKDVEATHIRAVNVYFDSEVQRAERFLEETWTPLFLRNLLGTSRILADLQDRRTIGEVSVQQMSAAAALYLSDPSEGDRFAEEVRAAVEVGRGDDVQKIRSVAKRFVAEDAKVEAATSHMAALLAVDTPAQLILEFAEAASEQINERRRTLIEPIEACRTEIIEGLRVAYRDIYAGQGVITGRLEAAARKDQEQRRLIDALGGEGTAAEVNDRMLNMVKGINAAFGRVETTVGQLREIGESGGEIIEATDRAINELIDGLKSVSDPAEVPRAPETDSGVAVDSDTGEGNAKQVP